MSILLLLFFILCCAEMKIAKEGEFFGDYMSPEKTNSIKGIFIITVFFSHLAGYLTLDGPFDSFFHVYRGWHGQLIVTMFLFYSGYGVMESIKNKGIGYVKSIPFRRCFKVLLHFDLAVLLYVVLRLIMGKGIEWKQLLFSFICWDSIGNNYCFPLSVGILLETVTGMFLA